jgi:hypothetical protein
VVIGIMVGPARAAETMQARAARRISDLVNMSVNDMTAAAGEQAESPSEKGAEIPAPCRGRGAQICIP